MKLVVEFINTKVCQYLHEGGESALFCSFLLVLCSSPRAVVSTSRQYGCSYGASSKDQSRGNFVDEKLGMRILVLILFFIPWSCTNGRSGAFCVVDASGGAVQRK